VDADHDNGSNRESVGDVQSLMETIMVVSAAAVGCGRSPCGHHHTAAISNSAAPVVTVTGHHHDVRAGFSARVMAACHVCWNDGARC